MGKGIWTVELQEDAGTCLNDVEVKKALYENSMHHSVMLTTSLY